MVTEGPFLISFDQTLRKELVRKTLHISIALVPLLARFNFVFTVLCLSVGSLFYIVNELARLNGHARGFISSVTMMAARPMEKGFIWGPVTLALGAMSALIYYPHPAASVAIYAVAFGDGLASLAGKFWRRKNITLPTGKTLIGSITCFLAVLISSLFVLNQILPALAAAATATLLETLPLKDGDNLVIPLGTGLLIFMIV
ncbi:MAG: phosphatidate cytidylyltransferase [Spirochaetales bacterium]|nr:MAG: phosphatidate cytidylyltransferase [Spirochaetales bacterium]